jgi:hypothetical protein
VTVSKRSWRECRFHALLALGFVCVSCLHRLGAVTWREAPLYRQGRWSLSANRWVLLVGDEDWMGLDAGVMMMHCSCVDM